MRLGHLTLDDELARRAKAPGTSPDFGTPDATAAAGLDTFVRDVRLGLPNAAQTLVDRAVLDAARTEQRQRSTAWLSDATADLLIQAEQLLVHPAVTAP